MAPSCIVRKQIKHLGIVRANPTEYIDRYGSSLKCSKELPQFILGCLNIFFNLNLIILFIYFRHSTTIWT